MIERCGDRQRKIDGLEKWPFQLFIESLPIMLQIALLLLSCGLSRYVWSVNTSVARVVISFTVLGVIFYLGIVIAGTSSYECPFQTPVSTALRALRGNRTTRKFLVSLSPPRVISFVYVAWNGAQQRITSRYHRIHGAVVNPRPWEISLSSISGIATNVGDRVIILLLHVDRAFGNAKYRIVQGVRRCKHVMLLPITHGVADHQPHALQPRAGFLIPVRNIASLRKRNAANARCVCWIIRNITDPEAIESAIRLAGTIRWFDGDVDVDPPFDFIVSTFEACFDSAKQPYPGMMDQAYFAGRAILLINATARFRSQECAFKYPIPRDCPRYALADKDLHRVLHWLAREQCIGTTLDPSLLGSTPTHSMWMSNLHVDITRADPNFFTCITLSMANNITPLGRATDANTILSWCISLGGHVQEETFWAHDKSFVVTPLLPLSARLTALYQRFFGSDPLTPISEGHGCHP